MIISIIVTEHDRKKFEDFLDWLQTGPDYPNVIKQTTLKRLPDTKDDYSVRLMLANIGSDTYTLKWGFSNQGTAYYTKKVSLAADSYGKMCCYIIGSMLIGVVDTEVFKENYHTIIAYMIEQTKEAQREAQRTVLLSARGCVTEICYAKSDTSNDFNVPCNEWWERIKKAAQS